MIGVYVVVVDVLQPKKNFTVIRRRVLFVLMSTSKSKERCAGKSWKISLAYPIASFQSNPSSVDSFLILWQWMKDCMIVRIIDIHPNSYWYGDWSVLLSGVSCTAYIIDAILLLVSMMHAAMHLSCSKGPSLMLVALPNYITFATVLLWSIDYTLLITHCSSIYNCVFVSYELLISISVDSVLGWYCICM